MKSMKSAPSFCASSNTSSRGSRPSPICDFQLVVEPSGSQDERFHGSGSLRSRRPPTATVERRGTRTLPESRPRATRRRPCYDGRPPRTREGLRTTAETCRSSSCYPSFSRRWRFRPLQRAGASQIEEGAVVDGVFQSLLLVLPDVRLEAFPLKDRVASLTRGEGVQYTYISEGGMT